jgi:hypothetical protein
VRIRIDRAAGVIAAAPSPWTARAPISTALEPASPHSSEANVNSATPTSSMRLRPSTSANRPHNNRSAPNVSMYEFATHVSSADDKPRSACIGGIASRTIAASRITMK